MSDSYIESAVIYLLPLLAIMITYLMRRKEKEKTSLQTYEENQVSGLTEPPSLHPIIDPNLCMGAGTCIKACPENAIGFIRGKAVLINPTHCIGHGACLPACPHHAIDLVFGTEKRGMDIPEVSQTFETNVPGIFIAGELGGMGLIGKSAAQGSQAVTSIAKLKGSANALDVVIVGAGPAGLSASLGAIENKLRFVTLEQEVSLGGTIFHYPRNKITMTSKVNFPIIGEVKMGEISKEKLLEFFNGVVEKTGLKINLNERMESITKTDKGFLVKTSRQTYETRSVLLSIGRRGTPRKLGVAGEELSKVVYSLIDPEQYRGMHVLVVGGGDSALEAAISIAEEPGTTVTLSYRSEAFGRGKPKNNEKLKAAAARGRIKVMLKSIVTLIEPDQVHVEQNGAVVIMPNDAVIVCAGGILPTPFLKEIGIMVETKYGTK